MSNPASADPNEYPTGWTRERLDAVIRHYDNQTDEEEAAEIESAEEVGGWMRVPKDLVAEVKALIRAHGKKAS